MLKTEQQLNTAIDGAITDNSTGDITGPVLNTLLKSFSASITGSYAFPADSSLTVGDIGKLVVNDGSGTAKVSQLSPPAAEQLGRWTIDINDDNWSDVSSDSMVSFQFGDGPELQYSRSDWRDGSTPASAAAELALLKTFIDGNTDLSSYISTSLVSGKLQLDESTYQGTTVKSYAMPMFSLVIVNTSHPDLNAAPTAFPLGKLIGLDGTNAIISNSAIETYKLSGTMVIDNSLYDYTSPFIVDDISIISKIFSYAVVPAADGKVSSFDITEYNLDSTFPASFRHQFVGIAIAADANSVTVINLTALSFVLGLFLKLGNAGVFGN